MLTILMMKTLNPIQMANGIDTNPTYVYRFAHIMSFDCWGENYTFCVGSCCHGSDLPFVFNVFSDGVSVDYDPTTQVELDLRMFNLKLECYLVFVQCSDVSSIV